MEYLTSSIYNSNSNHKHLELSSSSPHSLHPVGNLLSPALTRRVGPVRAMVYSHLPCGILLFLIPLSPSVMLAILMLIIRAGLGSMDQAPRTAFMSAVVKPHEQNSSDVIGVCGQDWVASFRTLSNWFAGWKWRVPGWLWWWRVG